MTWSAMHGPGSRQLSVASGSLDRERAVRGALNALAALLRWGGRVAAIGAAVTCSWYPEWVGAAWLTNQADRWAFDAFSAFGAMSGFALAALALVGSTSTDDRARRLTDTAAGRTALRALVAATWWWLVPALASLLAVFHPAEPVLAVVVGGAVMGATRSVLALLGLSLIFRLYTARR